MRLGSGVVQDARRLRWTSWAGDWALRGKARILAASTYICLASAIPALAFGVQAAADTDQLLSPVSVLAATAITGVIQALVGGQPLLIVGVAEPIVLTWGYMYSFAKDREGLGRERFLAWAAWCCVWAAAMILVLALTNACVYIRHFTRLSGELFGALIALLFMQQAIKGCVEEFRGGGSSDGPDASSSGGGGGSGGSADAATWQLVNGVWSLVLALGLLLSSLLLRTARSWRFLRAPLRSVLADYGAPLMLLAFTGLSFAVHGGNSSGSSSGGTGVHVPSRVQTPDVWDTSANHWTVAAGMGQLEGRWIAAAIVPAALVTVLFFFDHNVSAQLAQQEEFNLKKPPAYHWDFLLLGLMTLLCGLLGLPPVNGVLPQAPMHTKALAKVSGKRRSSGGSPTQQAQQAQQGQQPEGGGHRAGSGSPVSCRPAAAGCVELGTAGRRGEGHAASAGLEAAPPMGRGKALHLSPSAQALLPHTSGGSSTDLLAKVDGSSSTGAEVAPAEGGPAASPPVAAGEVLQAAQAWAAAGGSAAVGSASGAAGGGGIAAGGTGTSGPLSGPLSGPSCSPAGTAGAADEVVAVHVYEQRWSGLLQSLGVAACLAATPAIRQIPTACLWGYFAFMAVESLPGSQFWDRLLLMLTDPARRAVLLEQAHSPYLETVPFRVIAWFTAFQTAYLLLVYGITWAGVAGILFPLPIMALVPLRQWVLPRCFANPRHLQELDAAKEEEAAPLPRQQALQEAAAQGLDAGTAPPGGSRGSEESEGSLSDSELHRLRVVHHLSRGSLLHRRNAIGAANGTEAAAGAGAGAGTGAGAAGVPAGLAAAAASLPPAGAPAAGAAADGLPLPGTAWSPRTGAGLRRRSHELPHV